jgi:hypothetical protein
MQIIANLIACLIAREDQSARLSKGTGLSFHCWKWKFKSSPHLCAHKVSLNPRGKISVTLDSTILNHGRKQQPEASMTLDPIEGMKNHKDRSQKREAGS